MEVIREFSAPDLINHVEFSHDGSILAAASADGFVYLLDTASGALRARLGPHGDDVNAIAWHPSGAYLVCVMDAKDARLAVWDIAKGIDVASIRGHAHGVFSVAFSPSGDRLVTAAEDGTARIWDFATGTERLVLEHPGDPETADWSPCGRYIATGCDDARLRLWDATSGEEIASYLAGAAVRFVKFSQDGQRLLSGSYEGVARLHDVPSLDVAKVLTAPFQWERAAAFGAEGSVLIGSFAGGPVRHAPGRAPQQSGALTLGINALACVPGAHILVGRDDGCVADVEEGVVLYRHDSIVNSVAYSPAGQIASGDYRGCLKLFDPSRRQMVEERQVPGGPINSIAFEDKSGVMYTAGYDGVIRRWAGNLSGFDEIGRHAGPVKSLTWCASSGSLIAGSSDDTISAWRGTKRLFHISMDDLVLVNAVAAHPTRPEFASASRDGRVRIWDAESGALRETLPPIHTKSVKAVAYSPDGARLISGAYDGTGVLWERVGGLWRGHVLALHGKPGVPAVGFDGEAALTAGWDGTIGRWNRMGALITQYGCRTLCDAA